MGLIDTILGSKKENPFSEVLGSIGSSLSAGVGSTLADTIMGKDPVDEASDMMDTLYPGTTPYERLSAGGGGAAQAGANESLAWKQMANQKDIAQINANTQLKVAEKNKTSAENVARINANKIRGFGLEANPSGAATNALMEPIIEAGKWWDYHTDPEGLKRNTTNLINYLKNILSTKKKKPSSVGRPIKYDASDRLFSEENQAKWEAEQKEKLKTPFPKKKKKPIAYKKRQPIERDRTAI